MRVRADRRGRRDRARPRLVSASTLPRPPYFGAHAAVAAQANVGFLLEAATWRANADWGALLGFDEQALDEVNRQAVELLVDVRDEFADTGHPYPISGCLGPRGDAYRPDQLMTLDEASSYHRAQIETLADTDADLCSALTLADAIRSVDDATEAYPAYYMINCAHPSHFATVLDRDAAWTARIRGVRANASSKSHAELDDATELDSGDPISFGRD